MPKKLEGLGMRNLEEMDKNYILKLSWKLKSGYNSLRCKVMRGKYDKQNNIWQEVEANVHDFTLLKIITNLWLVMTSMTYWAIGDGQKVNAWEVF